MLFHLYKDSTTVGELVILENKAVSNKNLYVISKRAQLLNFIFSDSFLAGENWLPDGIGYIRSSSSSTSNNDKMATAHDLNGFRSEKLSEVDRNLYQRLRPKVIADVIEALIGKSFH